MSAYVNAMIEEGTRTELEEAFSEAIASRDQARKELAAKADEIARLRCKTFVSQEAEIARLKAVLEDVLKFSNDPGVIRFVRAALEEK